MTNSQQNHWSLAPFTARPVTLDDAECVTEMVNVAFYHDTGIANVDRPQWIRELWQASHVDINRDTLAYFTEDGRCVAYVHLLDAYEHHNQYRVRGRVHPEFRGLGLGTKLIEFSEARAQEKLPLAPPDARVVVLQSTVSSNDSAKSLLETHSYRINRHFFRMEITLEFEPVANLPEGFEIRHHNGSAEDDYIFYEVIEGAFADHWGHSEMKFEDWLHFTKSFGFDPLWWLLATYNGEPAGGAILMNAISEAENMAEVGDLGVLRAFRNRGLGLALLNYSFRQCYQHSKPRVALNVDADSLTGAVRLYEKAGMHIVRESLSYEKEIRAGVELSTQSV